MDDDPAPPAAGDDGASAEPADASVAPAARDWARGRFGRLVLPAVILQSVLIGGGYASGREVVEFGARFGPQGWMAVAAIFAGFTAVNVLVFEVARIARAYDYKAFLKELIGRAWPVFDVVFVTMAVLVIAVMASATGEVLEATLAVPALLGVGLAVLAVGVLTYHGAAVLERFKTGGTLLLYAGYLLFAGAVLWTMWPQVVQTLTAGAAGSVAGSSAAAGGGAAAGAGATTDASPATVIGTGVLYVGYNLAVYPAVLFVLHRQTTRRDAVVAAVLAGVLMTLPFLWTYLAVMAFYPAQAVLAAPVPWLAMLDGLGAPWLVVVYGVVVGWTLLETSTGLIHAILDRVDRDLAALEVDGPGGDGPGSAEDRAGGAAPEAAAAPASRRAGGLTRLQRGGLGAGVLVGAALLAQVGIVDLVAWGYTAMAFVFLAVFAVPLFTVGVRRILGPRIVVLEEIPEAKGE